MRKPLICITLLMSLPAVAAAQQKNPPDAAASLGDQVIQQVLQPLQTGMQTQNIQQILSVFDKKELDSYSELERQLRAFFQQYDEINFRYQLLQVTADDDRASATAEMQMDALPYGVTQTPVRRSVQMRLRLKQGTKGWKIAAFTPSDFFAVDFNGR